VILIIPSAQMLDYEMQSETGACTHALINLAGKPLFVHIIQCYQKIINEENLTVILIVKTGVKKLISSYIEYVDKCIEIDDSSSLLETINVGFEEGLANHTPDHDDQVVVHMADTLLLGKELTLQSDYIYASKGLDGYRWTLFNELNGLIKVDSDRVLSTLNTNEQLLFIGVFAFSSLHSLKKLSSEISYSKDAIDPFFKVIEKYSENKPLRVRVTDNWLDFGHLDTYYISKLNYQNLRHFNSLEFNNQTGVVTKRSKDPNFIHQIRWFELQPSEIQFYLPRVYEYSDGENPYISMEMLTIPTLSELFVNERLDLGVWSIILNRLKDILETFSKNKSDSEITYNMLYSMYVSKTVERLEIFINNNPDKKDLKCKAFPKGFSLSEVPKLIENYVNKYQLLSSIDLTAIHGDFCLTNLLYDQRSRIVKMIDPRGIFSSPGIYGDSRYDIAKIFHSILSGYDFIISDRFLVTVYKDTVECNINKTEYHDEIGQMTQELLVPDLIVRQQVRVIESLLFLSMLPLHEDRPDRQLAMISIGLELFNSSYSLDNSTL
jgi:hypothetical protein